MHISGPERRFARKFSSLQLAVSWGGSDYDYGKWSDTKILDIRGIWQEIRDHNYNHPTDWAIKWEDLKSFSKIREAIEICFEDCECWCKVQTKEEYEEERFQRRRRSFEEEAQKIAHSYSLHAVDSIEFLLACDVELERFQSYREGMREDGLCIGWGVSSEQWFDEFNESQSDTGRIYSLKEQFAEFFPVEYRRYRDMSQQQREYRTDKMLDKRNGRVLVHI